MSHVQNFSPNSSPIFLLQDERGLSTVEYVIILVLIAAAAVGAWSTLGTTIRTKISDADGQIVNGVTLEQNGSVESDSNGAYGKADR